MPASAIVDASVLVSAFLFPGSVPGKVVGLTGQGRFTMHLSPLLLDEICLAAISTTPWRENGAISVIATSGPIWC